MQLSIFDVLGPVMIGPSSSHTAGAAKLGRVAALIAQKPFDHVQFGLSGSFAKTGAGHGTHKALLAGVLGFSEDDERIREIETIAKIRDITAEYVEEDLDWMHENSVHITFDHTDGSKSEIWGSSIGGGRIVIRRINELEVELSAESPTLVLPHLDRTGVVKEISRVLADNEINIAVMRLARESRGKTSIAVIEIDGNIPQNLPEKLRKIEYVTEVVVIDVP